MILDSLFITIPLILTGVVIVLTLLRALHKQASDIKKRDEAILACLRLACHSDPEVMRSRIKELTELLEVPRTFWES